jgi:hypothetical protein
MIETREYGFGSVAVLEVASPSHQERVEIIDNISETA